ncbi:MAG TPA: sensor histidine kinase [Ktedonobacteraceae bacterium]|nr:sensor histidine kinase [Ktedonobacteraceae bacterium]
MSTRRNTDHALASMTSEQLWSTTGASAAYISIIIGYLLTIVTSPPHLTLWNFLAFTFLQFVYCALLWLLISRDLSNNLRFIIISVLTLLTVANGLLSFTGLQWDWLLYIVTISIYFTALSLGKAIILGVLLYLLLVGNLGYLNNWNWSHIYADLLSFLPAFIFVAFFCLLIRRLNLQKEQAETLVHQLEESNAELEEAHEQLQKYATEVEELTIVRERTRMAREIHDTLGHYLSILNIQLETISKLQERDPARAAIEIAEARRVASQSMQEVRNAIAALRPMSIATLSLSQAITQLCREFELSGSEVELTLDLETQLPAVSPDLQVALYRALQESLTNVRKHAHASKVLVRLRYEYDMLELVVLDNGSGGSSSEVDTQQEGFGLTGLRERLELLGGQVTYGPVEPAGYRVSVRVQVPSSPFSNDISAGIASGGKAEDSTQEPSQSKRNIR